MKKIVDGQMVQITLHSGVVVKGILLAEKDLLVKQEIKPTLPHYFLRVDSPLLRKQYKSSDCWFSGARMPQGGLIPTYLSDEYTLSQRREYTIATVYMSTIKEIK